jgi:hypothetical protein
LSKLAGGELKSAPLFGCKLAGYLKRLKFTSFHSALLSGGI